jgi:hypothetical protein
MIWSLIIAHSTNDGSKNDANSGPSVFITVERLENQLGRRDGGVKSSVKTSTRSWKRRKCRNSRGSNGTESFLPARVTDLKPDLLSVEINGTDLEIDANSRCVVLVERIVGEPEQQQALPRTWKSSEINIVLQIWRWFFPSFLPFPRAPILRQTSTKTLFSAVQCTFGQS